MSKLHGLETIKANIDRFGNDVIRKAEMALEYTIAESENEAKRKAPWTDRTGNARNSITGSGPMTNGGAIVAGLSIGVFYGKYLELSNQGKYRVLWPTLEGFSRQSLLSNLRSIL